MPTKKTTKVTYMSELDMPKFVSAPAVKEHEINQAPKPNPASTVKEHELTQVANPSGCTPPWKEAPLKPSRGGLRSQHIPPLQLRQRLETRGNTTMRKGPLFESLNVPPGFSPRLPVHTSKSGKNDEGKNAETQATMPINSSQPTPGLFRSLTHKSQKSTGSSPELSAHPSNSEKNAETQTPGSSGSQTQKSQKSTGTTPLHSSNQHMTRNSHENQVNRNDDTASPNLDGHVIEQHPLELERSNPDPSHSDNPTKKGRGRAINYQRADASEKIKLTFNDLRQIIGQTESQFTTLLGCIVRTPDRAPLDVVSWNKMPQVYLDSIWEEAKEKSDVPDWFHKQCLQMAGRIWRRWKSRAKMTYFNPIKDNEQLLAIPPDTNQIGADQWPRLVKYWKREDVQMRAEQNSENRKKRPYNHRKGRRSCANVRAKRKAKNLPNDTLSVFIDMVSREDGSVPDPKDQEYLKKINEELEKVPEEERTAEYREKIFTDLFGEEKGGRVRTMGPGVTPTDIYGPSSRARAGRRAYVQELQETVEDLKRRDMERDAAHAKKQMQLEKMISYLKTAVEAIGLEVPDFDIDTPRSSIGQSANNVENLDHYDEEDDEEDDEIH